MRSLIIFGGGGHAAVVAETALASGVPVAGFLDDRPAATLRGLAPRLGSLSAATHPELFCGHAAIIGVGDSRLRARLAASHTALEFATVVHPSAVISPTATLSAGVFVAPGAIVHTGAFVGAHAIVNSGAILEHDASLGAMAHLAPRACVGGDVRIGERALFGLGASAIPGVRIGDGAVVGAGSVVISDVEAGDTVAGNPARSIGAASGAEG